MRYLRSRLFDVGLGLTLAGTMAACYIAWDMLGLTLRYIFRSPSESGTGAASMNLSGFVLAFLLVTVGLAILVAGVIQVRRTT